MAKNGAVLLYCALALLMQGMSLLCKATDEDRKVRIVSKISMVLCLNSKFLLGMG